MHPCDHMELLITFCEIVVTGVFTLPRIEFAFLTQIYQRKNGNVMQTFAWWGSRIGLIFFFFFLCVKREPDYSLSLLHSLTRWLAYFPVVWQHAWNG